MSVFMCAWQRSKVQWSRCIHRATSHPVHHVLQHTQWRQLTTPQNYISQSALCLPTCSTKLDDNSTELHLTQCTMSPVCSTENNRATSHPVCHVSSVFNSQKTSPQSYSSPRELHLAQCDMSPVCSTVRKQLHRATSHPVCHVSQRVQQSQLQFEVGCVVVAGAAPGTETTKWDEMSTGMGLIRHHSSIFTWRVNWRTGQEDSVAAGFPGRKWPLFPTAKSKCHRERECSTQWWKVW